jgi:hypothetical protein
MMKLFRNVSTFPLTDEEIGQKPQIHGHGISYSRIPWVRDNERVRYTDQDRED